MSGTQVNSDLWINEYITPWDILIHGITKIIAYKKTNYQEMYIVETGIYGKALILDNKWQSSTGDEFLYHESLVQPAAICHGAPKNVLILGAGEGATAREILRWKTVEKVVTVDIDAEVVAACREYLPEMHGGAFDDPRVELVIGDALELLEKTTQEWDVIIFDLSEAIEEGPSFHLFTVESMKKIRNALKPDGFLGMQAGPISLTQLELHARLVNTVKEVFPHVRSYSSYILGEPWGFILASSEIIPDRPSPEKTDNLLQAQTTGGFGLIDGITFLGMMQTPTYIRRAIENYTEIFTLDRPPKAFGKGINSFL